MKTSPSPQTIKQTLSVPSLNYRGGEGGQLKLEIKQECIPVECVPSDAVEGGLPATPSLPSGGQNDRHV